LKENQQVDSNITNLLYDVKDKADHQLERYKAEAEELYQKNVRNISSS
jgi:hypothetical protein